MSGIFVWLYLTLRLEGRRPSLSLLGWNPIGNSGPLASVKLAVICLEVTHKIYSHKLDLILFFFMYC